MKRNWRWLSGFCNRVAYATLVSMWVWLGATMPSLWSIAPLRLLTYVLDLPVALVGLILPVSLRFIDMFFSRGIQEWAFLDAPQALFLHLRLSVPVYVSLFYILAFLSRVLRRRTPSAVPEHQKGESGSGL